MRRKREKFRPKVFLSSTFQLLSRNVLLVIRGWTHSLVSAFDEYAPPDVLCGRRLNWRGNVSSTDTFKTNGAATTIGCRKSQKKTEGKIIRVFLFFSPRRINEREPLLKVSLFNVWPFLDGFPSPSIDITTTPHGGKRKVLHVFGEGQEGSREGDGWTSRAAAMTRSTKRAVSLSLARTRRCLWPSKIKERPSPPLLTRPTQPTETNLIGLAFH